MSISTTDKPQDKREIIKELRRFHQESLDKESSTEVTFIPKMAYRPHGKTDLHIAFFASEMNKGDDIYVEFTSKELVPEDPERRLYKWRFNPHYEEEYSKTEPNPQTGHVRYLVPVEELQVIEKVSEGKKTEQIKLDFDDLPDANDDLPMDQMTIRDYAAIHMNKPISKKEWLNLLITK